MNNLILIISMFNLFFNNKQIINYDLFNHQIEVSIDNIAKEEKEYKDYLAAYYKKYYYMGEKKSDIARKLNRELNSTLKNKGAFIVEYSSKVGMDPYLATAVMLQETGCKWTCSYITRTCNNVGGNKGSPSCNGGSYKKFSTIEEGIKFAIDKLNYYYTEKGLKTTKEINPYYAGDSTWYVKVNRYMNRLKK